MKKTSLKCFVDLQLKEFIDREVNSSPYLIMTIFGDSVIPHGGEIWLGSLVQLLEPLGISERLVRTSVFRLSKDTWLESKKVGRKSFYSPKHIEEIKRNEQHLYYQQEKWDGNWRLVVGTSMDKACSKRDGFRKELQRNGFNSISPNVFGHPTFSITELNRLLSHYEQREFYVVLSARDTDCQPLNFLKSDKILHRGVREKLEKEYGGFIEQYSPMLEYNNEIADLSPQDSFLIKTLMINDYRRLLWHDSIRSSLLLGGEWAGRRARRLAATVYCELDKKGRQHFRSLAKCSENSMPPLENQFRKRFKHLI